MSYTANSPIRRTMQRSEVDLDKLTAWAVRNGARREGYLDEYFGVLLAGCLYTGIDFWVLAGQSHLETDNWRSPWWGNRGNPAGLGITGDAGQNSGSQIWETGEQSAFAHLSHMTAYIWGEDWIDHWNETWPDPIDANRRFTAPIRAGYRATVLDDLNGTWAIDPQNKYGEKIAARANLLREAALGKDIEPVAYNYGNGVLPPIVDVKVTEGNKFAGYIDPAQHVIRGFFIHSAYGYLASTSIYFQQGNALTDFMVGNALDGAALDGELRRFNDPNGGRYCHASGPVNNPIEDAAKFLELYGPNPSVINMYTTALERTCTPQGKGAVTEKEHKKRVALIAYYANRYGKYLFEKTGEHRFTCDTFPLIPKELNRSFLIYHGEANSGKRTTCPDPQVRATLPQIIADVRKLLSEWQKGTDVIDPEVPPEEMPEYAKPKVIEALQAYRDADTTPAYVKIGNDVFTFVNDRVKAKRKTPRYQTAKVGGERIGPDIEQGLEFAVNWLFWDEKDTPWYISPYWTRVLADDTERIKDVPA